MHRCRGTTPHLSRSTDRLHCALKALGQRILLQCCTVQLTQARAELRAPLIRACKGTSSTSCMTLSCGLCRLSVWQQPSPISKQAKGSMRVLDTSYQSLARAG